MGEGNVMGWVLAGRRGGGGVRGVVGVFVVRGGVLMCVGWGCWDLFLFLCDFFCVFLLVFDIVLLSLQVKKVFGFGKLFLRV